MLRSAQPKLLYEQKLLLFIYTVFQNLLLLRGMLRFAAARVIEQIISLPEGISRDVL